MREAINPPDRTVSIERQEASAIERQLVNERLDLQKVAYGESLIAHERSKFLTNLSKELRERGLFQDSMRAITQAQENGWLAFRSLCEYNNMRHSGEDEWGEMAEV